MGKYLGNYQLGKTIRKGRFGEVRHAKDDSGNRFAIKILKKDEDFSDLIKTEVKSLQQLKHLNIVNIIECSSDQLINSKKPNKSIYVEYIVLEYAKGGELFELVNT